MSLTINSKRVVGKTWPITLGWGQVTELRLALPSSAGRHVG